MIISGNGITTPIDVKIVTYKFNIDMSMKWFEMGDGSYKASDRGYENDHILSEISFHGKIDYINSIIEGLKNNQGSDGVLTLTSIEEPIFGHHVDYTQTVTAVLESIDIKEQKSLNGFSLKLMLRAAELSFQSLGNTLPDLKALEHSYVGDTEWSFLVNSTYNNQFYGTSGTININDFEVERGVFEGTFTFNDEDMAKLLDFQRTTRSLPFTLHTICGVDYPFGTLSGVGPYQAKLYSITNIKRLASNFWSVKLMFVQEF